MASDERLAVERFPRSSKYHPDWVFAGVSGGANPLWLTEWLTEALDLRPGMRVLDLGCGRAMSSVFLHREFGVQVWAVHSASWWRRDWLRSGIVDVITTDELTDGWRFWHEWISLVAPGDAAEIAALST